MSEIAFTPLVVRGVLYGAIMFPTSMALMALMGCLSRRTQRTSHLPGRWNWPSTILSAWLVSVASFLMLFVGDDILDSSRLLPLFLICGLVTLCMCVVLCLRYLRMNRKMASLTSLVVTVWIYAPLLLIFLSGNSSLCFSLIILQPILAPLLLAYGISIDPPDHEAAKRMATSEDASVRSKLRIMQIESRSGLYELVMLNVAVLLIAFALNHPSLLGRA